ncbi:MAG TPA: nuclear transport factor 2 family protein [Acidocella sp.]|nr:nuclear transport factor 2 family protein [Acidocella sp.]
MEAEVLAAAEALIKAFEANDRAAYFSAFTPEASFIFHATNRVLGSRAAYEAEYDSWVHDNGFCVLECSSFNRTATIYGTAAVFTHQTFTRLIMRGEEISQDERETIIFHKVGDRWMAVHEHLSLLPG